MKRISTLIKVSTDNKTWSKEMTIDDFIRRYKGGRDVKSVCISQVVSYQEALEYLLTN